MASFTRMAPRTWHAVPVQSDISCLPRGVSLNASMINGNTLGYFNMWPSNASFPTVATMIVGQGETVTSNGAIVPLGPYSDGNPDMYVRYSTGVKPGSANLTLDITGYFAP